MSRMTCPAKDARAPKHTCWERIPSITDPLEIARCQRCPHGQSLMDTVRHLPAIPSVAILDSEPQPDGRPHEPEEAGMTQQTYTYAELAELLGYKKSDISNAKYRYAKGCTPRIGSRVYKVLEAMRERGITWGQVGGCPTNTTSPALAAAQEPKAPTPSGTVTGKKADDEAGMSLEDLCVAIRSKLPQNTSITISN